jgi:hypothetical protein
MPFDSLPAAKPETKDAAILREAMDLIRDKHAWIKGTLYCEGGHCMAGAIFRAMGKTDDQLRGFEHTAGSYRALPRSVMRALNQATAQRSGRLITFWSYNDRGTTSHADVMAVMQAAYERLRWGDGA